MACPSPLLSLFTPTSTFQDLAHVLSFRNLSPNLHVVVLKHGLQIIKFDTRLLESGWAGVSTSVTFYTLDAEIGCQLTDPGTCYWVTRKATFMIRMCSAWDELVRPAGIGQPQSTQDSDAAHLSSLKPCSLSLPPHISLSVNHWEAQNVPNCISVPLHLAFSRLSLHNSYSSFRSTFDITSSRKPSSPLQGWHAQSLSLISHLTHCLLPPVSTSVSLWASEGQRMIYSFVSHQPLEQCQRLLWK